MILMGRLGDLNITTIKLHSANLSRCADIIRKNKNNNKCSYRIYEGRPRRIKTNNEWCLLPNYLKLHKIQIDINLDFIKISITSQFCSAQELKFYKLEPIPAVEQKENNIRAMKKLAGKSEETEIERIVV